MRDVELLDQRLRGRDAMTSQRAGVDRPPAAAAACGGHADVDSRALFRKWMESPLRPEDNVIIVDSTDSPETVRDDILKQIMGDSVLSGSSDD